MTDLLKTDNGIGGTLSEIKAVKTRGVIQMVIEAPIEHAEAIITAFGYPQPGKEKWVAVALLQAPESVSEPKAAKPKQKWDDMPPSQQAGILCADVEFQKWVTKGGNHPPDERGAKDAIYDHFNITSRAYLCNFVGRWNVLVACYRADTQGQAEMRS